MVAGGLAIIKQLFRDQLSNTELVTRLFETADSSGFYADSAIYGRGSMDLGAATSPVGVLELPVGENVGQNGFSLQSTRLQPGSAFGDGLQQSLAARQIMALDELGAPFWYRLGRFTPAANGLPLTARLRGFLAPEPGWDGPVSATAMARGEAGVGTRRGAGDPPHRPSGVDGGGPGEPSGPGRRWREGHPGRAGWSVRRGLRHQGRSGTKARRGRRAELAAGRVAARSFGPAGSASVRPSWGASAKALSATLPATPPSWVWTRAPAWAGGGSAPTRSSAWSPRRREADS